MQATQQATARPAYNYANFYKECAQYPELPKFHRFIQPWAKKLYDDAEELLRKEQELNDALAVFRSSEGGAALTALECPRRLVDDDGNLRTIWDDYENKLRLYTQDLILSHQLFSLPDHAAHASKRLQNRNLNLFPNGTFGPTGEDGAAAAAYRDRASPDFAAWVGVPGADILTNFFISHSQWIEDHLLRYLRALCGCRRPSRRGSHQTYIRLATIVMAIDLLTCVFVPLLLTANMFALVSIRPLKVRIAVVGVFGLAFAVSAKVISTRISRGEIFAYTAAFFAVASVFVSGTDDEVSGSP